MPGTSSTRPATSQIDSPMVFAYAARRAWLVSPIPRRGELTMRAKEIASAGLTRSWR